MTRIIITLHTHEDDETARRIADRVTSQALTLPGVIQTQQWLADDAGSERYERFGRRVQELISGREFNAERFEDIAEVAVALDIPIEEWQPPVYPETPDDTRSWGDV